MTGTPSTAATNPANEPLARAGAPLRATGWLFVALLFVSPLAQLAYEKRRDQPLQALDYFRPFAHGPGGRGLATWSRELGNDLIDATRLRRFDSELHDASFITKELLPGYQWLLTRTFGHGNEKVVPGRDGWLFFADDLKSAYGKGYLEADVGGAEALAAITDFKGQLDARGIALLLIPSYSKELLDADRLSRFSAGAPSAPNPDLERFYAELTARGLDFVRMDELLAQCRAAQPDPSAPLALPRDTHWSPSTMAFCAGSIGARVRELLMEPPPVAHRYEKRSVATLGQGDLVRMLGLPEEQELYPPMKLTLETIVDPATDHPVAPDPTGDVLLMGDSLTKIFSDPTLGLGDGSGLAEHLAWHLDRALDVIAIAGGSATGTREALARREGDGLAGKKLVLWQFGVRMLASGGKEWRKVALPPPAARAAPAGVPTDRVTLVGELVEVSKIPTDFDYDFCLAVHEYKVVRVIDGALSPRLKSDRFWVAFPAIVDGKDQPPRRYTVGMRHRLVVEDYRLRYDENTSCWDETDAGKVIYVPVEWEEAKE